MLCALSLLTHSLFTVRVVLLWLLTDMPRDASSNWARQIYWPASDIPTGFRMCNRYKPEPLATSWLLGAIQWIVGTTVRKGTTDTLHSRTCWSPAVTVEFTVVVTSGYGRAEREREMVSDGG